MVMLSSAQQVSFELGSASAELTDDRLSDQHPALRYADDAELDAEWLSAQLGAAVGCSHRIVRHLASGGMGHVFVAEHDYLGALAAVKVPRYADAAGRKVLEAEARLLAKLEHPNIVRAQDAKASAAHCQSKRQHHNGKHGMRIPHSREQPASRLHLCLQ